MRLRLLLVLALFAALPAAAATIGGTVRSESGNTLAGMTVAAYDTNGIQRGTTTTDASGKYTLTLSAGSYHVLAYDNAGVYATSFYNGAESFDTSNVLVLQTTLTGIDFTLQRGGTVAGFVTSKDGATLPNMVVALYNLSGTLRGSTRTDATGRYQLIVPPGAFKLAAWDDALVYAPSFYANAANFSAATPLNVTAGATTTANLSLGDIAHLRGTVRDEITGAAVANAIVTAYDANGFAAATATTGANGTFDLTLRAGSYRLVYEERSGLYASAFYLNANSFEDALAVTVGEGETRNALDATLPRAATLRGILRDASTGAPLANMTVAAFNASGSVRAFVTSGADGRFTLLVPTGDYKLGAYDTALVYAYAPPFATAALLHVNAPQTLDGLELALPRGGRVSGHVTASGITVGAYDANGILVASTITNDAGNYTLVVAPGTYTLAAFDRALRYVTVTSPITIAENATLTRDFALSLAAAITITADDITTRTPVAGITVSAYDATGTLVATATTSLAGTAGLALPSGTYRFVAADPAHRYATSFYANADTFEHAQPLTVIAGQSTSLAFHLTVAPRTQKRHAVRH
ncbi:MAG TPA: carboxypeptidase regulatory-like domain-containing protein [Thermoanaerobaculia bacterium]|nr:carboxypeptidase regulatory-like domain-containing protein [Thermoanaerobaculia bacterium]